MQIPIGEYYIEIQMLIQSQKSVWYISITEDLSNISSESIRRPELDRDILVHRLVFT
jgi:hypothetical protein